VIPLNADRIASTIREFANSHVRLEPSSGPGRIDVRIPTAELLRFADHLHARLAARPELIVAEDTRSSGEGFSLRYIFELPASDAFVVATIVLDRDQRAFPSLATRWFAASLFEREIHDLFGLTASHHPDLRRLPLHQFWPSRYHPLLKDAHRPEVFRDEGQPFPFQQVRGDGIYQITVGPVHAGIIEPGHFRFSVDGETIVNLESRLYFVHKGIEKLFEAMPAPRAVELAERISGDSAVGHAMAFCLALERCCGVEPPARAAYFRVILQELERLYNHVADVGAICTDTGFAIVNAHVLRLREDLLRLNERLSGHRLLRGTVVPGGVTIKDASNARLFDILETVQRVKSELQELVAIAMDSALTMDRLHGTGVLSREIAQELQICGIAARASGIDADCRRDHPYAAYRKLQFRVSVHEDGDVLARMMVRVDEAYESAGLITQAINALPAGDMIAGLGSLPEGATAFGLVEGWRGPIWHWVSIGPGGALARVKVKDPSFANWPALSYAILNNIVPDFPLCNKSFNLSYAGNDL
jgi:Ni,Fe-hydrogenase III large subunit/Ni,Fe-hydrogenase III component G